MTSDPSRGSVDDLEDIANLDQYISQSGVISIFCSQGYFSSKNCMIELRAAVRMNKQIILL